ncbi:hypothetical protein [Vitiosangium sp. GDMCC 1.1324]|uniref:hypothetical protein n=1 Tax=Vitiosangium sp. (strain GDMCC 1.1324) TaxID=2138576 RepID=UPI000D335A3D|nr:hypothetical protein [Vitiosangium sp. GDMCC 1.1324]PTL85026.1 hypothetical protein DAT35_08275 [Vitiosangium sp. GDMCC 1.1324]
MGSPGFFTAWEGERFSIPKTPRGLSSREASPVDGAEGADTPLERVRAAEELLEATLSRSDTWLETLRWKASWSQHFQFAGQLLPLLGGAAFLTQLSEHSGVVRDVLGLMTFLGSIVGLCARHAERTLVQGHGASELLPQLVEARAHGERLRWGLRVWRRSGQDERFGQELIDQAHAVTHRLHTLGPMVGDSPLRALLLRLHAPKSTR